MHWSAEVQTKVCNPSTDCASVCAGLLYSYFAFCKIVVKIEKCIIILQMVLYLYSVVLVYFPLVLHQGFGVAFGNFSELRKIIHLMYTGKML